MDNSSSLSIAFQGALRGVGIQAIIYPLERVKVALQCEPLKRGTREMVSTLYEKGGIKEFYRGSSAQFGKIGVKSVYSWPIIAKLPPYLIELGPLMQLAITGACIGTLDSLANPLEKLKNQFAAHSSDSLSIKKISWHHLTNDPLRGWGLNWLSSSLSWSIFLVTQQVLKETYLKYTQESTLHLPQLTLIGVGTALVVGTVTAPFDILKTLKQVEAAPSLILKKPSNFQRGAHLRIAGLMINSVASVILIHSIAPSTH